MTKHEVRAVEKVAFFNPEDRSMFKKQLAEYLGAFSLEELLDCSHKLVDMYWKAEVGNVEFNHDDVHLFAEPTLEALMTHQNSEDAIKAAHWIVHGCAAASNRALDRVHLVNVGLGAATQ